MRLEINVNDRDDAVYLHLTEEEIADTRKSLNGDIYDLDANGNVVGIEVLGASKRFEDVRHLTPERMIASVLGQTQRFDAAA